MPQPTTPAQPLRPSQAAQRRRNHATRRALRRWLKRGLLAVAGVGIVGAVVYAWLPKPVAVDLATAHRATLEVEVAEDGQTRVRDRFAISAPITGNLERVELEAGAPVTDGQVVAHIRPLDPALLDRRTRDEAAARLSAALAHQHQADTQIARATAARDLAIRDADRARRLADRTAIPAAEREHAELAERLAIADVSTAELARTAAGAEVAAARAVLGGGSGGAAAPPFPVRAPAAGRVLRIVRDSAGPVMAGAPLLEVGDPGALEVVVDVLSSDAARITSGMEVRLESWGGDRPLAGRVRAIEPSAFTRISALGVEEQRVKVIATIDDVPPTLGDGFRVEARIITWRGDVLVVPASAVFRDHGRWAVYAEDGGRARLRPVELGHHGRLDVEVEGGLAPGARVVLHPSDQVADGVRLAPR